MLLESVNQSPTHFLWLDGFLSEIPGRFPLSLAYCRHYIHRFLTIAENLLEKFLQDLGFEGR